MPLSWKSPLVAALAACCGCTTGQVGVTPTQHVLPPSAFSLEMAVGTATVTNTDGSARTGLNVVASFRQPNGQNATLLNTPTLSGPASFGGAHSVTGVTPTQVQTAAAAIAAGTYDPTTQKPPGAFGAAIGVFGYGFAPLNFEDQIVDKVLPGCNGNFYPNDFGDRVHYDALVLPLVFNIFCQTTNTANVPYVPTQYYGGPPAWPSPQGYGIPAQAGVATFLGYPFGFTDFDDVAPVAGSYALSVAYPSSSGGSAYATLTTSATLTSTAPLPVFPKPAVRLQPDGSAFVDIDVPAGATEAIVDISTTACMRDPLSGLDDLPVRYFSLLTHQTGPQTLFLSSALGPPDASGNPTDTFCTASDDQQPQHTNGHQYGVAAVAVDYPLYEASYPQSTTPKPVLAGSNGQADISTAPAQNDVVYSLGAP